MLCKSATTRKWLLPPFFLLCLVAPHARAAVLSASVVYEEIGGPKDEVQNFAAGDLFTITNNSDIGELSSVMLALADGLLFDTDYLTDVAGTARVGELPACVNLTETHLPTKLAVYAIAPAIAIRTPWAGLG
jgi:hypothetical protein